jgi:alkylation response protein AidB-like acyl-CoA dehydrogenase
MDREGFLTSIEKFCQTRIEPTAGDDDRMERFQREIYEELASLGVTSITVPEKYGGMELPTLHYIWAMEDIARYSVAYAVTLAVSGLVQNALLTFGTEEQKSNHLPKLMTGQAIGSFALTEPTSGSDAASLKTKAEKKGSHYVLNGSKQFITSGSIASIFLVMARTGGDGSEGVSAFLVPREAKGLAIGKRETKMGWRASPTTSITFEDCQIPSTCLLGSPGEGFKVALGGLDSGRLNIGAIGVGLAQRAMEEATRYACERKQFGQPIIEFQGVGFMLADMKMKIEAARSLLYRVAEMKERNEPIRELAAAAKCFATDTAMAVTTDAVQVLGGYGYMMDYPVERYMRDAKVLQIVEGTNQIQRVVIARGLQKEFQA